MILPIFDLLELAVTKELDAVGRRNGSLDQRPLSDAAGVHMRECLTSAER